MLHIDTVVKEILLAKCGASLSILLMTLDNNKTWVATMKVVYKQ